MKTVMCVDDSPTIRMLVKKTLGSEGYEIVEAENGQEGLNKVSGAVDFLIVDVNMPVMNGFDFVKTLKEKSEYKDLPVVFLTTESSADKKAMGKSLGVKGWIVKPFEPEALKKIVSMFAG